jgi:hypothetical protein
MKHNCPCFKRKNIKYLLKSIPKNFIKEKNQSKIKSWFNLSNNLCENNIKNIFNLNVKNLKICLILHCFDFNEFEEYQSEIEKIKKFLDVDVYVTTNSKIKKTTGVNSYPNKGMDIGPFIKTIDSLIKKNKKYDYLIKIHGKNIKCFRELCFSNIIDQIYKHILLLNNSESIISGPEFYSLEMDDINLKTIEDFIKRNNIVLGNKENNFFAGTMFVAKYQQFIDFFKKINLDLEYNMLENGPIDNFEPTNTHAWERILTNIIPNFYNVKNKSL